MRKTVLALAAALAMNLYAEVAFPQAGGTLPSDAPRFTRERAVVAVLAYNPATEVTDYVVPYGILAEAGVAEVVAVATGEGPIRISPALRFQAQATTQQFDARFADGADYVVVPNIYERQNDPAVLAWVRAQAGRGAIIVGIARPAGHHGADSATA